MRLKEDGYTESAYENYHIFRNRPMLNPECNERNFIYAECNCIFRWNDTFTKVGSREVEYQ